MLELGVSDMGTVMEGARVDVIYRIIFAEVENCHPQDTK